MKIQLFYCRKRREEASMKQLWKRNAVAAVILVLVCAAIFLNGRYAEKAEKPAKVLGQAQQVDV